MKVRRERGDRTWKSVGEGDEARDADRRRDIAAERWLPGAPKRRRLFIAACPSIAARGSEAILRRKLGGNRVIPKPDDRLRLLAIGAEINHAIADGIGIVTPQTYSGWVVEQRDGA